MYRIYSASGYMLDSFAKLNVALSNFRRHNQARYLYAGRLLLAEKKVQ